MRARDGSEQVQHQDTSGAVAEAVDECGGWAAARAIPKFAETTVFVQSRENSSRAPSR